MNELLRRGRFPPLPPTLRWRVMPGKEPAMQFNVILIQPLLALIVGVLILVLPRLLNYLIALYLILIGLAGLFPHLFTTLRS